MTGQTIQNIIKIPFWIAFVLTFLQQKPPEIKKRQKRKNVTKSKTVKEVLPRDAMLEQRYIICCHRMSFCASQAGIVSKQLYEAYFHFFNTFNFMTATF